MEQYTSSPEFIEWSSQEYGSITWKSINEISRITGLSPTDLFRGSNVVDLGCGSIMTRDSMFTGWYEPFFCRYAGLIGAKTIGVDYNFGLPEDGKYYTHVRDDLLTLLASPYNLDYLITRYLGSPEEGETGVIDVLHTANVFGDNISPEFQDALAARIGTSDEGAINEELARLRQNFWDFAQVHVKPNGIIVYDDKVYRNGENGPELIGQFKSS